LVTYSLLAANQVMSLIFDGVFDRFESLRVVFVEHAFSWILPLMWRMDSIYRRVGRGWTSSASLRSTSRTTSSSPPSAGLPEDRLAVPRARRNGSRQDPALQLGLSDWTFDDPRWLVKHLLRRSREAVMSATVLRRYKLPETVSGP